MFLIKCLRGFRRRSRLRAANGSVFLLALFVRCSHCPRKNWACIYVLYTPVKCFSLLKCIRAEGLIWPSGLATPLGFGLGKFHKEYSFENRCIRVRSCIPQPSGCSSFFLRNTPLKINQSGGGRLCIVRSSAPQTMQALLRLAAIVSAAEGLAQGFLRSGRCSCRCVSGIPATRRLWPLAALGIGIGLSRSCGINTPFYSASRLALIRLHAWRMFWLCVVYSTFVRKSRHGLRSRWLPIRQ